MKRILGIVAILSVLIPAVLIAQELDPVVTESQPEATVLTAHEENGSIRMNWEEVPAATHYRILEWDQSADGIQTAADNIVDTTYLLEDRIVGHEYHVNVVTVGDGWELWSNWVVVTVQSEPVPTDTPAATDTPESEEEEPTSTPEPTATSPPEAEPTAVQPEPTATAAATNTPESTATPGPTATLTPAPTPTIDPTLYCTLIDYAAGDERWPSIHVPLLQNDTVVAYRNKYGQNIEDLDIFSVDHYLDGRTAIWYVGRSDTWNIRRIVAEFYRGCQYLGHTDWIDWEY